jgi:steroid delta-isomerase-like uncharacterized protein
MSETNKALARQFYERLNAGDPTVIDDLISDDLVEHEPFPGLEANKEGVRMMFEMFRTAFPDVKFEVDDIIAEGDKVCVRARMTGTHQGEFMGMPPTGRTINVGIADFLRTDNGKAVEHWSVTDTGAMMQQLTGD